MSTIERGGLKAAFSNFKNPDPEREAELKLLGRTVDSPVEASSTATQQAGVGYAVATSPVLSPQPVTTGSSLIPRPLVHREAVRQLSFRCPVTLASELKRKAAFNQLEQQEIIVEGLKRVLRELAEPPEGWQE